MPLRAKLLARDGRGTAVCSGQKVLFPGKQEASTATVKALGPGIIVYWSATVPHSSHLPLGCPTRKPSVLLVCGHECPLLGKDMP